MIECRVVKNWAHKQHDIKTIQLCDLLRPNLLSRTAEVNVTGFMETIPNRTLEVTR